jgi:hypothetical protein
MTQIRQWRANLAKIIIKTFSMVSLFFAEMARHKALNNNQIMGCIINNKLVQMNSKRHLFLPISSKRWIMHLAVIAFLLGIA